MVPVIAIWKLTIWKLTSIQEVTLGITKFLSLYLHDAVAKVIILVTTVTRVTFIISCRGICWHQIFQENDVCSHSDGLNYLEEHHSQVLLICQCRVLNNSEMEKLLSIDPYHYPSQTIFWDAAYYLSPISW